MEVLFPSLSLGKKQNKKRVCDAFSGFYCSEANCLFSPREFLLLISSDPAFDPSPQMKFVSKETIIFVQCTHNLVIK